MSIVNKSIVKGYKSQEEILSANKNRAYKLYKEGYYKLDIISDDIIRINDKYDILVSKDNSFICNCDDFVYRSGHYSVYYCKHIFLYLFTAASKVTNIDMRSIDSKVYMRYK